MKKRTVIKYKSGEEIAKELFPGFHKGPASEYARIVPKKPKPDEEPKDEEEKTNREETGEKKKPPYKETEEEE